MTKSWNEGSEQSSEQRRTVPASMEVLRLDWNQPRFRTASFPFLPFGNWGIRCHPALVLLVYIGCIGAEVSLVLQAQRWRAIVPESCANGIKPGLTFHLSLI